ncbi:serine hydrolase [Geodermatophilus sabuli]|uniref:Serine hydrolase n=1 Tax=Geodermatophilus sabuli TaxID=1564158 RepID=A0A7K3VVK9_9ACTN|nr:serine hydrolase [Geodermatophilus sabuli]NEK56671.1 serine hydrolase [Geodermatophilus sabuli]
MPAAGSHTRGPRAARALLTALLLLVLALSDPLVRPGDAAASGARGTEVVAAVTAAYGPTGTLAVAVAAQHTRATGLTVRAVEARSARLLAATAANGLGDRPFPTASMVKLFVAEELLHRARTGRIVLTLGDLATMQVMIARSDDPAASSLWVRFDGAQMVRDVAVRYRLRGTTPPAVRGQWGETMTTANDLARFLALLPVVAHPDDAETLLGWMRGATPIAADGFDQQFGVFGTVPGTPAVKQGWMCCVAGNRHLHSVGVIDQRVVVLLSEVPRTVGYDAARAALDTAAAAIPLPQDR